MSFREEVIEACGVKSFRWSFIGSSADSNISIYFEHTPSKDKPKGQPLSFEQLEALHKKFTIEKVESISSGKTGSELHVEVTNEYQGPKLYDWICPECGKGHQFRDNSGPKECLKCHTFLKPNP